MTVDELTEAEPTALALLEVPNAYGSAHEQLIAAVYAVQPGCTDDVFDNAQAFIEALGKLYRAAKAQFEQNTIAKINQDGDIEINGIRYYVGVDRTKKCLDVPAALEALYIAAGGDAAAVGDCLSTTSIKPGAAAKLLGPAFDNHFVTKERLDLKTGKPARRLQKFDPRFCK